MSLFAQTPEVTTKESAVTFRSGVNLIPVPVVVRDSKGQPVDNLTIDDFQLTDNGKPQAISKFSIERLTKQSASEPPNPTAPPSATPREAPDGIPTRFVAYFFDDIHMQLTDLAYTREAARRQIDSTNGPQERIAIYSTSGAPMQDFTADKAKLNAALSALSIGAAAATKTLEEEICPPMSYYQADLILNRNDPQAKFVAIRDAEKCHSSEVVPPDSIHTGDVSGILPPDNLIARRAREIVQRGDMETERSFDAIRNVIARLASMPGQRIVVIVSPGFLVTNDLHDRQAALIERAIRQNVVINALDSRGVYLAGTAEAADRINNPDTIRETLQLRRMEAFTLTDVMALLTEGTGGILYQGSNDMNEGIARTAAAPDVMYVLSFSPLDLKTDGKLHHVNVTLKSGRGKNLQFRKSYFAPQPAANPAERAKHELEEAFFSRDEVHDLPAALETQFFKSPSGDATISAIAKLDVKSLAFRRENDRNLDNVTVVTGLFDADGNFMSGVQKLVELRLRDATIQLHAASGLGVKNTFAVHSGKYIVRMVARDSEGGLLTSQSALVEIP
ncbi:MAG TPA: VWA domain-containing protein [Bryobacteraceae bacterium]